MNSIIIDDDEASRKILEELIQNNSMINLKNQFDHPLQAIKYLNENAIELIFLDIHMPEFTGFDLIKSLKNLPKVILTTSDKNRAIEAFEHQCIIDYLVKPVAKERFEKAIDKASNFKFGAFDKAKPQGVTSYLYVSIERRLVKIEIADIFLIEAKGDYIFIKTSKNNYTVHSTLKKIEEKLPSEVFLKVHRSFIINIRKIVDIEDNSVLIEKDVVPVSRSHRSELMKRLNLL
ncbi:LytTR family DNA-binding domain-containing protein [Mesonia sp. K7]|uniref:LytR/AlgR family response regulator transcription factor n=1 Tax=Mesonia sp. K7 TaxID=2218606 RepID=UPI000DA78C19|nr:LytTR family DNA-binding domain-containing protein [Mesonia sp. K7]PZD76762.1 DNA-binding response regulator [Mesonia sp. K7]